MYVSKRSSRVVEAGGSWGIAWLSAYHAGEQCTRAGPLIHSRLSVAAGFWEPKASQIVCVFCSPPWSSWSSPDWPWEGTHTQATILDIDGFRELLPEFRHAGGEPTVVSPQCDEGACPQAVRFDSILADAVAAETGRIPTLAIHVVWALPVLPATGVLIDLKSLALRGLEAVVHVLRPLDLPCPGTSQRELEREIAEEERTRVAQVPQTAAVTSPPGIMQSETRYGSRTGLRKRRVEPENGNADDDGP